MKVKILNKQVVERENSLSNNISLSVDTMILVAKLTDEQKEELFNRIILYQKNTYQDKYFHYSRQIKNIIIKAYPRNPLTNITYNAMLILQKNASLTEIPYSIKEILQFDTWKIKRMNLLLILQIILHSPHTPTVLY